MRISDWSSDVCSSDLQPSRRLAAPGRLPPVLVIEVFELDQDGEMLARPTVWDDDRGRPPRIYVAPDHRSRAVLAMGERALARAKLCDDGSYEAHVIRKLDRQPQRGPADRKSVGRGKRVSVRVDLGGGRISK